MSEDTSPRILGFDLHDGRHYVLMHPPATDGDDDNKTRQRVLLVYRPSYLENPGPAALQPGEQRYMISAHGGRVIRIRCTEDDDYELTSVPLPSRFKAIEPPATDEVRMLRPIGRTNDANLQAYVQPSLRPSPEAQKKTESDALPPVDAALLQEAMDELGSLTGLDNVKQALRRKISYAARKRELMELGDKSEEQISLHLVLTGNPGTGKTTVARIYGKILKGLGLLREGHLVESKQDDLVGTHIGSTAPKTNKLCDKALDGVLYIDEAHHMLPDLEGNGGTFKKEALGILTKRMEDDRQRLVVVLSGYGDRPDGPGLDTLVARTPGFPSRFKTFINHDDYTDPELASIFNGMVKQQGFILAPGAEQAALEAIARRKREAGKDFENGREVRNIIENAIEQNSARLFPPDAVQKAVADMSKKQKANRLITLKTLTAADFNAQSHAYVRRAGQTREIGFLASWRQFDPRYAPLYNKKNGAKPAPH